jgi:hypothetical protein
MKSVVIIIATLFLCTKLFAIAGNITSITGPTQITRLNDKIKGELQTIIEMNDIVETLNSRTGITFVDNTIVSVTEHSKLIVDSFVYDPSNGTGKIRMKAALGTIRYTTGKIAHNNHNNVNVQTPTASIAVRGTDFSLTVDEIGKSLIILLPALNKENGKYKVGVIDVKTDAGSVTLDKAFEATIVSSAFTPPTPPVVLKIDEGGIGNNLLLDTPKEITNDSISKQSHENIEKQQIQQIYNSAKAIEVIDNSKFVFVNDGVYATLKNNIGGDIISLKIPGTSNATLIYNYSGGTVSAKNGAGDGISINITQR